MLLEIVSRTGPHVHHLSVVISWAALDGLIVALQAQDKFLNGKKTWTRKLVLVTDGENEMQTEGWKETAEKMNEWEVITSIV